MNKQRGFSLLEILMAFAILALSLGILLKIFSGGVNTAGVAEEYNAAVQIAESLMAKAGIENPLKTEELTGLENEKFHWRVSVSPFQLSDLNFDVTTLNVLLYRVRVTVNWGDVNSTQDARQVELVTLKLVTKAL